MACEYKCTSCLIDKKPETAVSFCIVCVEYLCEECMKSHGKTKATRYHKLMTGKDIPANIEIYQKLAKSLLCKIHPEREVQLECKDHDEFICALCLRSTHRKCENIEDLDEVKDDIQEDKEKLGILKNNCEEKIKQVNLVKQAREEKIESLLREKILCKDERKRLLQEIDKKLEDAVEKEINELIHETKESILDCNNSEEMHKKQYSFLEVVSKYSDTKQLKVILTEATKVSIGQIKDVCVEPKSFIASTSNNVLIKLLEETEFISGLAHDQQINKESKEVADKDKVFGETVESEECISSIDDEKSIQLDDPDETGNAGPSLRQFISPNSPFGKECPDYNHEDVDDKSADTQKKDPDPYGIEICNKLLLDCTLKLSDTRVCKDVLPSDCIVLMDGRIVLIHGVDNAKANLPSMSVHNGEFEFLFNYDLLEEPCAVCHLEGEDVAITYKKEMRIDIFKVLPSKIEKVSEFSTSLFCRSVCLHNGKLIALCCTLNAFQNAGYEDIRIQFLDNNNGKLIKEIIDLRYDLSDTLTIMIDPKGCFLLEGKGHVLCLNGDCSKLLSSVSRHTNDFKSYGMTVDNEGNLYVCGDNSIYQMRAGNLDKNYERLLHKWENIYRARWIAFDGKKERLIVGFDNDTIKVYNFV